MFSDPSGHFLEGTINTVKQIVNNTKKSIVVEVGNGPGTGLKIDVLGVGIGAAKYVNDNITINNGKAICSKTYVKDIKVGIIGKTEEVYTVIPCKGQKTLASSQIERNTYYSFLFFEFGRNSTFVGVQADFHFIGGGHFKLGFDLPPLIPEEKHSMPSSPGYISKDMQKF